VLLRFDGSGLADFMGSAQKLAEGMDADFLWQCCGQDEFPFDALAREYYGHAPAPLESAGLLIKLHGAPMYFYKKGRGRYKAAPPDALKAALASVERKRKEAEQRTRYVAQLTAGQFPAEFEALKTALLYKPEKNGVEWKALEEACEKLKLTPARLFERCGALASSHDYHLGRFLFEYFPRGTAAAVTPAPEAPQELPLAVVEAFSIDDVSTTEIDDAFSVQKLANGNVRVGIHIAAPALGIIPGSPVDAVARERLSTVYYPGGKITMLPDAAVDAFTLMERRECAALSLYLEVAADLSIVSRTTRAERVTIADNVRHGALEAAFNEQTLAAGKVEHLHGEALMLLWRLARSLEDKRRGAAPEQEPRPEYSFHVENDRVRITRRLRGSPIDKLVSELMIELNAFWGAQLASSGISGIFRVQDGGKVRMSTIPSRHEGLGVQCYAWASSPLRRYVDLVNQRQLLALARGEEPPYRTNDEALLAAMRDFESTYEAYGEFQRQMERYWCLRWLVQENVEKTTATVIRESLVRFDELPLVVRVPSLPALPAGAGVELAVSAIDPLELTFHSEFRRQLEPAAQATPSS